MPAPSVSGAILCLQRGQLLEVGLDDRPDVDPHVVHVQPVPAAPRRGARPADRLQAVRDGPLGVRQADDLAPLVADDGELAHLGERDQPLVGRVLRRHALVEQHVLGRLEPGHVEVAQPPQVSRRPTIGCTPRTRVSSTTPPAPSGRKVK